MRAAPILLLIVVLSSLTGISTARPEYMKPFKDFDDKIKKCTLCHVQSSGYGGLNPFGKDFAELRALTPELMQLDSDGDRYSNIEELRAGTMPGDASSYPGNQTPGFEVLFGLAALVGLAALRGKR
mgnify:CR=1 FL=1